MEARVHQERIGPIDEHGGMCQWAVERKHPLTRLVDPASARCLGVRVTGKVDELELGQLGTDALDELAVAKLETQSQRVVSQVCSPYALAHPLQIHRALQSGVADCLHDREIRIARTNRRRCLAGKPSTASALVGFPGCFALPRSPEAPSNVERAGQVPGQRCRCRMVEDSGGRQLQTGRRFEPIPELDRTQRIEAELLELLVRADRVRGVVPEHDGRVGTDDVEQFVFLFGRAHRREPLSEIGGGFDRGSRLGGAPCRTDQTTEHWWQARNRRMGPDGGEVESVPA